MSNRKYDSGREDFANGGDWDTQNYKALLVDTTLAFNNAHRTIADISSSVVSRSANLSSKTLTDGKCACDDAVFTTPTSGHTVNVVIARDSGTDATSPLIAFFDTGTNFPGHTAGVDMTFEASAVPYLFTT